MSAPGGGGRRGAGVPPPRPSSRGRGPLRRRLARRPRRAGRLAALGSRGRRSARPHPRAGRVPLRLRGVGGRRGPRRWHPPPGSRRRGRAARRRWSPDPGRWAGMASAAARARGVWRIVEVPLELRGPLQGATLGHDGYPTLEVRADLSRASALRPRRGSSSLRSRRSSTRDQPVLLGEPSGPEAVSVRAGAPRRLPGAPPRLGAPRPLPVPDPGDLPLSPATARAQAATAALLAGVHRRRSPSPGSGRAGLAGRPRRRRRVDGARASQGGLGEAALGDRGGRRPRATGPGPGGLEWAGQRADVAPLVEDAGAPSGGLGPGPAILLTDPPGRSGGAGPRRRRGRGRLLTRTLGVGVDRDHGRLDPGLRPLRPAINTLVPGTRRSGPARGRGEAGRRPWGRRRGASLAPRAGPRGAEGPAGASASGPWRGRWSRSWWASGGVGGFSAVSRSPRQPQRVSGVVHGEVGRPGARRRALGAGR